MRHKGKVNLRTLSMEVQAELRDKGMAQRGLLRYFLRGNTVWVKRV